MRVWAALVLLGPLLANWGYLEAPLDLIGQIVEVEITGASKNALAGRLVPEETCAA